MRRRSNSKAQHPHVHELSRLFVDLIIDMQSRHGDEYDQGGGAVMQRPDYWLQYILDLDLIILFLVLRMESFGLLSGLALY